MEIAINKNFFLFRLFRQRLSLSKRQKIIIAAFLVTLGLVYTQNVSLFERTKYIIGLSVFSFFVSLWALWEGMNRVKAATLLLLPTLFTLGMASFYFLLPIRWLTRLPTDLAFGLMFYFLLLSQNVFNVAAVRTIPLYRAASTVTFLFTIITAVLLFHILHAFALGSIWNGAIVAIIGFLLIMPIVWSVEMEEISFRLLIYSGVLSLLLGEFALALSFWPIPSNSLMWSIGLSSVLFILLGIVLDFLRDRFTQKEVYLYLGFGALVLVVMTLTSTWVG